MPHPHPITPQEMNLYLAGDLDRIQAARIRAHCEECTECERHRRLVAWTRVFHGAPVVSEPVYLLDCFSAETLETFLDQTSDLEAEERTMIEEHLRHCTRCQRELEIIRWDNIDTVAQLC